MTVADIYTMAGKLEWSDEELFDFLRDNGHPKEARELANRVIERHASWGWSTEWWENLRDSGS